MNQEQLSSILVIDDEEFLRKTLAFLLEAKGYRVTQAGSGKETYEQCEQHLPDLVLLDLKLPDIQGLDLLTGIVQKYPRLRVVVLTAQAQVQYAIDAIRRGAVDYLIKPASPEVILGKVKQALTMPTRDLNERDIDAEVDRLLRRLDGEENEKLENGD